MCESSAAGREFTTALCQIESLLNRFVSRGPQDRSAQDNTDRQEIRRLDYYNKFTKKKFKHFVILSAVKASPGWRTCPGVV